MFKDVKEFLLLKFDPNMRHKVPFPRPTHIYKTKNRQTNTNNNNNNTTTQCIEQKTNRQTQTPYHASKVNTHTC